MTPQVPPPVPQPQGEAPRGFVHHRVAREWTIPLSRDVVWAWLCDPETFTKGQVWPFFVEFADGGFAPGVRNTHTGPFLHCCGVIGEVRAPEYRDLNYNYGAYVLGMRLIRPTRLQFWLAEEGAATTRVRMQLDSHMKPWLRGLWSLANRLFWGRFGTWLERGAAKRARRTGMLAAEA